MKLAILFCIVALACVSQAQPHGVALKEVEDRGAIIEAAREKLEQAKKKIDELINKATGVLKEKIAEAKKKADELTEKLKQSAQEISDKVYEAIQKILDKLDREIDEIVVDAKTLGAVDVSECTKMKETLHEAGLAIVADVSSCINTKIEHGLEIVQEIQGVGEKALLEVATIREDANECVQNTEDLLSILAAMRCLAVSGTKATWTVTKTVPTVTLKIAKMTALLATLPPSLTVCMAKNAIPAFAEQTKTVVHSIKECIKEKVEQAGQQEPDLEGEELQKFISVGVEEIYRQYPQIAEEVEKKPAEYESPIVFPEEN